MRSENNLKYCQVLLGNLKMNICKAFRKMMTIKGEPGDPGSKFSYEGKYTCVPSWVFILEYIHSCVKYHIRATVLHNSSATPTCIELRVWRKYEVSGSYSLGNTEARDNKQCTTALFLMVSDGKLPQSSSTGDTV